VICVPHFHSYLVGLRSVTLKDCRGQHRISNLTMRFTARVPAIWYRVALFTSLLTQPFEAGGCTRKPAVPAQPLLLTCVFEPANMPYKLADLLAEAHGGPSAIWQEQSGAPAAKLTASLSSDTTPPETPKPAPLSTPISDAPQASPAEMSGKRQSTLRHGQPGREFEEERPDEPADEPKKATAAQLAQRK
jgi:hypothetical protein